MENKRYSKLLKEKDIRCTKQRIEILKIIDDNDIPMTAAEIDNELDNKDFKIRLSTIYRNLKHFSDKGVLRKLNFHGDEKRYELLNGKHHQHLICIKCGEIIPIKCPLGKYEKDIKNKTNYKIIRHDIEMYGICPNCQEK